MPSPTRSGNPLMCHLICRKFLMASYLREEIPLSARVSERERGDGQLEELMQEGRASVDHAAINREVLKYAPQIEEPCHRRKRPVWIS